MADIGITAKLEYENGSTWVVVPNLKSVTLPSLSVGDVDVTNLSHSDYYKRFIAGTIDAGSITFSCDFESTVFANLFAKLRETVGWRVTAPDSQNTSVTVDGYLKAVSSSFEPEGQIVINAEVKLTGVVDVGDAA